MRPPFRSVSFPSLRQWGALLPPKKAKRLQRDCTSLRPSCWPLHFVGKCSLVSLARLGSVVSLRSPPSAFHSLRSFSAAALPALATLRPTALQAFDLRFAVSLAPLVRFSVSLRKGKRYFREKRAFGANAHFSRKWNIWFLFRLRSTKTRFAKKYFT